MQEAKENIKNKTIKSIPREIRDDTHSWNNKEPLEIENIIARAKTLINDLEDKVEVSSRKKKKTKKMEIVERKKKKSIGSLQNVLFLSKMWKTPGQGFCMF